LALLMDQSVSGAATEIGLVVQEIQSYLETELRHGELQEDTDNALLVSRGSWISENAIIRVPDARGRDRFCSNTAAQPTADLTRNEFFIAHRDSSDAGLLVSKLIPSRFSQDWVHVFSRRYDDADGRFAGVITATVPASHFVRLISGLDLGPNGIALVRD